jgi:NTE family protein
MSFRLLKPFLSLFLTALTIVTIAQERPKVGLVLSGGGAKGIAHVGVLKALENAGIRPDYITGTSMGAVVGGLYSIGYSSDDIREIILKIDWDLILSNQVPLNYISFEEKEYFNRFQLTFAIENKSIVLPSGMIEGQMLSETLQYYCWPAIQYEDFDEFPIPFRCVATDVRTGSPVVFRDGSLPLAIRASMALPSAFTAVPLDSTLLVDGGVTNNFPTDEVIKMGADIVIGVNVSTKLDEALPTSMSDILMSLAMIPSSMVLEQSINDCDIYIEPFLGDYSTGSFGNATEILELGDLTGFAFQAQFDSLAAVLSDNPEPIQSEVTNLMYTINEITLEGNYLFSDELVYNKLGIEPSQMVTPSQLEEGMRRIFGINGFAQVTYDIDPLPNGTCNLTVNMTELGKNRLSTSIHINNVFAAGVLFNVTSRDLILKESRSIFELDVSRNPRFRFDYYKYVGVEKSFAFNLRYDFAREQIPFYEEGELSDVSTNNSNRIGAHFISTQSLKQSFSIGGQLEFVGVSSNYSIIAPESIKNVRQRNLFADLGYARNSLNNRNFPTRGATFTAQFRAYFNPEYTVNLQPDIDSVSLGEGFYIPADLYQELIDAEVEARTPDFYTSFLMRSSKYFYLNDKNQIVPYGALGFTIANDGDSLLVDSWNLGGFFQVEFDDIRAYGYNYAEAQPSNFGMVGLNYQHVFAKKLFLSVGANYMVLYDYIRFENLSTAVNADSFKEASNLGYGARLSLKTRLGPITAGASSNTDDGYFRYYLSFGFSMNYND